LGELKGNKKILINVVSWESAKFAKIIV